MMTKDDSAKVASEEILLADHYEDGKPSNEDNYLAGLGKPASGHLYSWQDYVVVTGCLTAFIVALLVVFVPRYAIYWGQTTQFIWVGLCLTAMAWCAQLPVRRLFLVSSINSRASTLQSLDAILRSDPTVRLADWRIRLLLALMLGLGPALSVAYKALGGGQSHSVRHDATAQLGLTGPPGTQNLGFGLSQFVNATLPWYKDPGSPDRVYGFNMHVATENVTAMLDGPMPSYISGIQASLRTEQSKMVTANVTALVCQQNDRLSKSTDYYVKLYNGQGAQNGTRIVLGVAWVNDNKLHVAMLFPNQTDNRDIVVGNYNQSANESFGDHLRQYTLSRQKYTGTWHISKTSVQLTRAVPQHQPVDDRGLLSDNFRSCADLYAVTLAEYDWRYSDSGDSPSAAMNDVSKYRDNIKSDSTFLAAMVWSRLVAVDGPEVWAPDTTYGVYGSGPLAPGGRPELRYDERVVEETVATTIKPRWGIAFVLALNPVMLFASLLCRVLAWPYSPIGEGFGTISLLASVEQRSLALLRGAGFSGTLRRRVFVGFLVGSGSDGVDAPEREEVVTLLDTEELASQALSKGTLYS